MQPQALVDLTPLLRIALLGAVLASGPLAWLWSTQRGSTPAARLHGLTLLTLFLTFDLVVFGAFTRLSDSGLGCPDWPGCYGSASPLGAEARIAVEARAIPTGAVTNAKAWIEMIHRYLATAVGVLITVLAVRRWAVRGDEAAVSPWWATATLLWVGLQGAFGALTVTMRLYPAIVTAHLLGGIGLLALLGAQTRMAADRALASESRSFGWPVTLVLLVCVVQAALGGWVSANYAVLACSDFPTCQGMWWPPMDFARGFTLLRPLGHTADGAFLPFPALTAIHVAHRIGAAAVFIALGWLVWRMRDRGRRLRRWALALAALALWQLASGLGNVVLGWPMSAALAHTAGAAALVGLLAALRMSRRAPPGPAGRSQPASGSSGAEPAGATRKIAVR